MTNGDATHRLDIHDLHVSFGGVNAVRGLSATVEAGQVVSLIGPNGAGKTTVLNAISGFVRVKSGSIRFGNIDLTAQPAFRRAQSGIARTFQGMELFNNLTVLENVMVGGHSGERTGTLAAMARVGPSRSEEARSRKAAIDLLESLDLTGLVRKKAGDLSLASQKMIAIARALAASPKLLLLDEPAAGMSGESIDELGRMIQDLAHNRGLAVMLVEHHMDLVMDVSDVIVVMHEGALLTTGKPADIRDHPEVISVYLGTALEPTDASVEGTPVAG
jgi:branched-chain amino acid transport system ATP-binding protein